MGKAPPRIRQQRMRVGWSRLELAVALRALTFRTAMPEEVGAAILADGRLLLVLLRVGTHRDVVLCRHGMMVMMVSNGGEL